MYNSYILIFKATETPVQEEATNEGSGDNVEDEEEDISSALNKELQELKAESEKPVNWRKFQVWPKLKMLHSTFST